MKYLLLTLPVLLISAVFYTVPVYAQGEEEIIPMEDVIEVSGRIQDVDYQRSMITVRVYLDEQESIPKDYDIFVTEEAVIESDGNRITFSQLSPLDLVTVEFIKAENGENEATHIWVKGS